MGQRLLVLGLLGVLLTSALLGTALISMSDVSDVNRELARVSRALNHHKNAEEMHDALRADVARAQLVASGELTAPAATAASVRHDTRRDAARFRAALRAAAGVTLPQALETALSRLRPDQKNYITITKRRVKSALSPRGLSPIDEATYEVAFRALVPHQRQVTRRLMATTARVQAAAVTQREQAQRTVILTAAGVLAGWLALAAWHHRSMRHLQQALVREADQRAAADLLQGSLLPTDLPRVQGARLAARSVPGNAEHRVGGDWYDALNLPTGEVFLVVGDVVGHDLPAAVVMGQLRNALRAYALEDSSPESVLTRLNRAAYLLETSDLATCVVAVLDPRTMTGRWASAGHPPPLLVSPEGSGRLLSGEPGPPVGVTAPAQYPEHEVRLCGGAALLLYSDGLVERREVPIDVGMSTLEAVPFAHTEPEAIVEQVLEAMLDGTNPDDVTCLLLRVDPRPSATDGDLTPAPAGTPTVCR
jgi:serine phosphatase RsbU (regulator of sigma subunit)